MSRIGFNSIKTGSDHQRASSQVIIVYLQKTMETAALKWICNLEARGVNIDSTLNNAAVGAEEKTSSDWPVYTSLHTFEEEKMTVQNRIRRKKLDRGEFTAIKILYRERVNQFRITSSYNPEGRDICYRSHTNADLHMAAKYPYFQALIK